MSRWKGYCLVAFRILWSIIIPIILFIYLFWICAKDWHRGFIKWTWGAVALSWVLVFLNFLLFLAARRKGRRWDAKWQLFNTIQLAGAIVLATFYGNSQYHEFWDRIYDYSALETYVNVNPLKDIGEGFLDAGQLYFKEGSRVDTEHGIAFKNYDVFCVAPIIREVLDRGAEKGTTGSDSGLLKTPDSGTVDFFAVGMNCCEPNGENFACGDVGGNARSGLRQVQEEARPFYVMAAEAWSAKYNIPAKHPIFVNWVVDPLAKVGALDTDAGKAYANTEKRYKQFNIVCVLAFVVLFQGWDYRSK